MEWPVTYLRKIRYSDTDAQGIAFNGNYFTYFDDVLTDYLDAAGFAGTALTERGYDIVLAHAELDFRASARLGETLAVTARVERIGTTSVTFALEARNRDSGDVVVEAKEIHVMVDTKTFRPILVPQFFKHAVERLQGPIGD